MKVRALRDPILRDRAREMRAVGTSAEKVLWAELRAHRLGGWKWKRQAPRGHYVIDFLCDEAGVAVEVDGNSHLDRGEYDARRTDYLKLCGLRLLRFRNEEVLLERERVCLTILASLGGFRPGWAPGVSRRTPGVSGKAEPPLS